MTFYLPFINNTLHTIYITYTSHSYTTQQEPLFEKMFVDAIKCVLSSVDLTAMGTTEAELLGVVATKAVVIVRNTLGFLY